EVPMSDRPAVTMPGENLLPSDVDVDELVRAEHGNPFAILGPHSDGDGLVIRAYLPNALGVDVLDRSGINALGSMEQGQVPGFFVIRLSNPQPYLLKIRWAGGEQITEDPFSFGPQLGEVDMHLFSEGNHRQIGRVFGAQPMEVDGVQGVRFAVWAPNARRVSVVGSFNDWDGRRHPMRLRFPSGVWEIFIPRLQPGDRYKFEILGQHGILPLKADPVALATELPPGTASVISHPLEYEWKDEAWLQQRVARQSVKAPMTIYELHAGSWRRDGGDDGRLYDWHELAERLIPYVVDMGFTHI